VAVEPFPKAVAGAPAIAYALPNPARGRVSLRIVGGPARPPGSRAVFYDVAGRRLGALDAAGEGDAALLWSGADDSGRAIAPGVVLVDVRGPGGASLGRGRFVWLP
jgi:hypothetical protein